jgi:hypothetical protein
MHLVSVQRSTARHTPGGRHEASGGRHSQKASSAPPRPPRSAAARPLGQIYSAHTHHSLALRQPTWAAVRDCSAPLACLSASSAPTSCPVASLKRATSRLHLEDRRESEASKKGKSNAWGAVRGAKQVQTCGSCRVAVAVGHPLAALHVPTQEQHGSRHI